MYSIAGGAVEYSLDSALEATAQHDDNIRLSVNDQESVYGHSINPKSKAELRSENWQVSADLELRFSEFSDEGYDSDDQYLTLKGESRNEKYTTGFSGKITRDTTRTSEGADSGRVSNDRRVAYLVSPYWQYLLNESHLVAISGSAQKVDYKDEDYIGYTNWSAQVQWTYLFTDRLKLNTNLNASNYESDGLTDEYTFLANVDGVLIPIRAEEQTYFTNTNGLGYQLGFEYQLTEGLAFDGLWGKSDTETNYDVDDPAQVCGSILIGGLCNLQDSDAKTDQKNLGLDWKDEYSQLKASYTLRTQPSSDGYVLEQESYNLFWGYRASDTANISMDATYGENEALGGSSIQNRTFRSERKYWTVVGRYRHRIYEDWYVKASIRYRYQDRKIDRGDAEALGGQVGIEYRPTKLVW